MSMICADHASAGHTMVTSGGGGALEVPKPFLLAPSLGLVLLFDDTAREGASYALGTSLR